MIVTREEVASSSHLSLMSLRTAYIPHLNGVGLCQLFNSVISKR
nr:MAG TPA: hypothetical protein [Caudoviricetes sp.]